MKQFLSFFIFILFLTGLVYSQTAKEIHDEAYPENKIVTDNSPYAQLWKQVVEARKSGNDYLHNALREQIKQQYPDRFSHVEYSSILPHAGTEGTIPPFINQDWIVGEVIIYSGNISTPTNGNPNPFDRLIKVESDSNGIQYTAFVNGTRDTLFVYKSAGTLHGNWSRIQYILPGSGQKFHSFDMFIADSLNVFRLGFALSTVSENGSGYDGSLFWATMNDNGSGFRAQVIQATPGGRGLISPAIISDGYTWSANNTYWYVAYQNVDVNTGVGNLALLSLTDDWGYNWLIDTARSSYNDYELDVEYTYDADTIYVLLTNNLTTSNENLRLRYSALSNIGTGVSFKQYNPASTSAPEKAGCLTSNRSSSDLVVTYTIVESGNNNISYSYGIDGYTWITGVPLSNSSQSETRAKIECQENAGIYHICHVSTISGYDSVIYYKSSNISTGFGDRHAVNDYFNSSSSSVSPDIVGFKFSSPTSAGGTAFAGSGESTLYYDNSVLFVGIKPFRNEIPKVFSLLQNYPNPFNPITVIEFNIPKNEFVTLNVYNVTGELVKSLLSSGINAGSFKYSFDGSGLSSGIYFYRLQAGEYTETRKMILIK